MDHASYTCDGLTYRVSFIEDTSSIDSDIATVIDTVQDTDIDVYRSNMVMSVEQHLAYCIYKNDVRVGFVYNRVENGLYLGSSINITDTIAMLIALKTMFEIYDYHKIQFVPHNRDIRMFKSMAYGPDIRSYYSSNEYLVIRREDIEKNGLRLFKYLGIQYL